MPTPPVTVLRPVFRPVVAESVTVLRVPVVTPTVLLRLDVVAFTPRERAEGDFAVVEVGWPSGLTVLVGVFLAVAVVVVLDFTGVAPVAVFAVVLGLETGVVVVVSFLTAVGFVVVLVGFDALLMGVFVVVTGVFLTGVAAMAAGLVADLVGSVFCVPSGVLSFLTGVAFAAVLVFSTAGVDAGVEVR